MSAQRFNTVEVVMRGLKPNHNGLIEVGGSLALAALFLAFFFV